MHLVPESTINEELSKGRYLLTAEKFNFDKAEIAQLEQEIEAGQEEEDALLENDAFKDFKDQLEEIKGRVEKKQKEWREKKRE